MKEAAVPSGYDVNYFGKRTGGSISDSTGTGDSAYVHSESDYSRISIGATDALDVKIVNSKYVIPSSTKTWAGDSDDFYGTRPATLTLNLQTKVENDGTVYWRDVVDSERKSITATLASNATEAEWTAKTKEVATAAKLKNYTGMAIEISGKLTISIRNEYRWAETATLGTSVKMAAGYDKTDNSSEASTVDLYNGDTIAITNTMPTVDVTFTKNWTDGNNQYGLRPDSIWVKLQKSTDGGSTFTDVLGGTGTT